MKNRFAVLMAVLAIGVAGCAPETAGTPAPASESSSQAGGSDVRKVTKPLDLVKFESNPCDLLSQAVAAEYEFTTPGVVVPTAESVSGPYCGWVNPNNGRSLSVRIQVANQKNGIGGLAGLYTGHDTGKMPFLEKAPDILGYQAVFADLKDQRPRGSCNLHVGVMDDLVFTVGDQGYTGPQDSCDLVQKVAAAVVKTLMEA